MFRHVARVLERGGGYILRGGGGGLGDLPQKNFKFKVANTPKFNDFLQLPKKFWISSAHDGSARPPASGHSQRRSSMH